MPRTTNEKAALLTLRQIARDKTADPKTRLEAAKLILTVSAELAEQSLNNPAPKARKSHRTASGFGLADLLEETPEQTEQITQAAQTALT
jgi:hypothetical protein